MREWWYDVVQSKYEPKPDIVRLEEKIDTLVLSVNDKNDEIDNLKATLKEYMNLKIDNITTETVQVSSSGIVNLPFSSAFNPREFDASIGEGCITTTTVAGNASHKKFYKGDEETI